MLAQSHVKDRWILPGDGIAALVVRPRVQLVVIARRGRGGAARSAVLSPDMVRETRPAPARRPGSSPAIDAALALACALLALWTQRRALSVYFHPDDLISMEWTRGILPSPDFGLWRLLSGKAYFAAALGVFGTDPFPYHALNALVHMANVVLLYALARRWGGSRIAATLAAGLFGAARPAFSVLQQAVGIGELLALGLSLGALLACEARTLAGRAAAVLLFAAALLSKEAVLLLPLVLLLPRQLAGWSEPASWRERLRAASPLLLTGLAAALVLVIGNVRNRAFGGEAYAMAFGGELFHNLMTYVAWAFNLRDPFFDDPGGISFTAWHVGLPLLAFLLVLAWLTRRRTQLPVIGLAWAALTIAPVLPLTHHTYATYLYTPLAGLALAIACGLEALLTALRPARRERPSRAAARAANDRGSAAAVAWAGAIVLLVGYAVASDRLLGERVERRVESIDLPFDRQLRKSEMVRRAAQGLRRTGTPRRIVLYMPPEASNQLDQRTGEVHADTTLALDDMLMVRVLDHGRALRALVPGLDSVAFVRRWTPAYAEFDLCANSPAGDIVDFGQGPDAHLKLGQLLLQSGKHHLAEDLLTSATAAYAQDPRLRQLLEAAKAR